MIQVNLFYKCDQIFLWGSLEYFM